MRLRILRIDLQRATEGFLPLLLLSERERQLADGALLREGALLGGEGRLELLLRLGLVVGLRQVGLLEEDHPLRSDRLDGAGLLGQSLVVVAERVVELLQGLRDLPLHEIEVRVFLVLGDGFLHALVGVEEALQS